MRDGHEMLQVPNPNDANGSPSARISLHSARAMIPVVPESAEDLRQLGKWGLGLEKLMEHCHFCEVMAFIDGGKGRLVAWPYTVNCKSEWIVFVPKMEGV